MNDTGGTEGNYHVICQLLYGPPTQIDFVTNLSSSSDSSGNSSRDTHGGSKDRKSAVAPNLGLLTSVDTPEYEKTFCVLTITICVIGILGNILNVIIFLKRSRLIKPNSIEKPANAGFLALSVCDLFFCVLAMVKYTLPPNTIMYDSPNVTLYFELYFLPFLDILFKISNWLTVILAVTRYLAVCHPIKTRQYFSAKKTYAAICCCNLIWILLLIPLFYTYKIEYISCSGHQLIALDFGVFSNDLVLRKSFRCTWSVLGFFVPAGILMFCNTSLMVAFRQSARVQANSQMAQVNKMSHRNRKITLTLIVVVVMFIVLVSPSQILEFYYFVMENAEVWTLTLSFRICNVLQVANSCVNFFVYMTINVYFRRTLLSCVPFCWDRVTPGAMMRSDLHSSSTSSAYRKGATRQASLSSISSAKILFTHPHKASRSDVTVV